MLFCKATKTRAIAYNLLNLYDTHEITFTPPAKLSKAKKDAIER